jgi:hypothetical protein
VGHDDPRHAKPRQVPRDDPLSDVVERARGLVEQEDPGPARERAGDQQPLPLPAREGAAVQRHQRLHRHRHRPDLVGQRHHLGQHRVDDDHRGAVDDHDHQADRDARELARQDRDDLSVVLDPQRQVGHRAGDEVALGEPERVKDEPSRLDDGQARPQPDQDELLEQLDPALQQDEQGQHRHERPGSVGLSAHQHVVDEHLRHARDGQARDRGQEPEHDHRQHLAEHGPPPSCQRAQARRPLAALLERRRRPEGQDDLRVVAIELLDRDAPRPGGRVVQPGVLVVEPFEHKEVGTLPQQHERETRGPRAGGDRGSSPCPPGRTGKPS